MELGTSIPESGGEYAYLLRGLRCRPLAFLCSWMNVLAMRPAVVGIIVKAFASYALEPFSNHGHIQPGRPLELAQDALAVAALRGVDKST